ncbi:hypothetical protein [Nonomuraea typhae]|uniref:hypothetical protein n=1 Tax=Nonomuraea typhae TaxID=2603600 RepID=UPI0012FAEBD4|nr:hypothetical protein [Nonomuraea typhae]
MTTWAGGTGSVAVAGDVSGTVITNAPGLPVQAALRGAGRLFDECAALVGRQWLTSRVDAFLAREPRGYFLIEADAGMGKSVYAAWLATTRGYPGHFTREGGDVRLASTAVRNLGAQLIIARDLHDLAPGGLLPAEAAGPAWLSRVLSAAVAQGPVVLVVDGLDEAADADPGALPLGLPAELPDGVHVIATLRPGTALPGLREPYEVCKFGDHRDDDLADLRRHIGALVQAMPTDLPEDEAVDLLMDRCGGVWVYLHYVAASGRLDQSLPRGLEDYYAANLDGLRAWLPLLATLAVAEEPLDAPSLVRLSGVGDVDSVTDLLTGPLRPFCRVEEDTFAFYHASLRDFFTGAAAGPALDAQESARRRRARAGRDAHDRIGSHYLSCDIDGYGRRHLVTHLLAAGRVSDVHALLARENSEGRNLWHELHETAGDVFGFLQDVELARKASDSPALEIRYRMIEASLLSTVRRMPVELLAGLVREGVWAWERGLDHVMRHPDPACQVRVWEQLLPLMPAARRDQAVEALFARVPRERRGPLVELLPNMSAEHRTELVHDILAMCRPRYVVRMVELMGPLLAPEDARDAFDSILAEADDDFHMCHLAAVAPFLPDGERQSALEWICAESAGLANQAAMVRVADLLSRSRRADLIAEVTDRGSQWLRVEAFEFLSAGERHRLIDEAMAERDLIVMVALVRKVSRRDRPRIVRQVLNQLDKEPWLLGIHLVELAPYAEGPEREYALERARSAGPDVLAAFARPGDRDLLLEALGALPAETADLEWAEFLAATAPLMPVQVREHALDRALRAAFAVPHYPFPFSMMAALAPERSAEILEHASHGNGDLHALLTCVADSLAAQSLGTALAMAESISDPRQRVLSLCALLPRLDGDLRGATLVKAVSMARGLGSASDQAEALVELAPYLPAEHAAELVDWLDSAVLLAELVPALHEPLRAHAVDKTLRLARTATLHIVLSRVAPYCTPHQLRDVMVWLEKADPGAGALGLALIAPYCPKVVRDTIVRRVLREAERIPAAGFHQHPVVTLVRSRLVRDLQQLARLSPDVRVLGLATLFSIGAGNDALNHWPTGIARPQALGILTEAAGWLAERGAVEDVVKAVDDVFRWWP